MLLKILLATLIMVITYLIVTRREHFKMYEIDLEATHRPNNSWKKYYDACLTNCKNNNSAKTDIQKCITRKCENISSITNPNKWIKPSIDQVNFKGFSEFIKENEEYIVPRNIVTWTFNKMDITNTGLLYKNKLNKYKKTMDLAFVNKKTFDNFISLNKKHFKNSNLWDRRKIFKKLDKKSQTFFSWGYLKNNIKTIKNHESNTYYNEKNLSLKHIDETLLPDNKNPTFLNKIEEGFENSDNKTFKKPFQYTLQKNLQRKLTKNEVNTDKLTLEIGKRLINDGIIKNYIDQNCGSWCRINSNDDMILDNIKVDDSTIYDIYNPDSQVKMYIDKNLISGRKYNSNKNFWENVPRKVVDKVCSREDGCNVDEWND